MTAGTVHGTSAVYKVVGASVKVACTAASTPSFGGMLFLCQPERAVIVQGDRVAAVAVCGVYTANKHKCEAVQVKQVGLGEGHDIVVGLIAAGGCEGVVLSGCAICLPVGTPLCAAVWRTALSSDQHRSRQGERTHSTYRRRQMDHGNTGEEVTEDARV